MKRSRDDLIEDDYEDPLEIKYVQPANENEYAEQNERSLNHKVRKNAIQKRPLRQPQKQSEVKRKKNFNVGLYDLEAKGAIIVVVICVAILIGFTIFKVMDWKKKNKNTSVNITPTVHSAPTVETVNDNSFDLMGNMDILN